MCTRLELAADTGWYAYMQQGCMAGQVTMMLAWVVGPRSGPLGRACGWLAGGGRAGLASGGSARRVRQAHGALQPFAGAAQRVHGGSGRAGA